jgi:hypothetical protein
LLETDGNEAQVGNLRGVTHKSIFIWLFARVIVHLKEGVEEKVVNTMKNGVLIFAAD